MPSLSAVDVLQLVSCVVVNIPVEFLFRCIYKIDPDTPFMPDASILEDFREILFFTGTY